MLKYSSTKTIKNNIMFEGNKIFKYSKYYNFSSSKVYDNIVKFSNDINNNEFKVPAYGNNYSIYYKRDELVSDLQQRIVGSDEKIMKVDFLNYDGDIITDLNKPIREFIKSPFKIKINNFMMIRYFPSINIVIPEIKTQKDHAIMNHYNYLLYQTLALGNIKREEFISQIQKNVDGLLKTYEDLKKLFEKSESILIKRYERTKNTYIWLGILFFILHAITFYVLIYQLYGWDTIEPITYIVGNVYWIIGLLFFISKRKKLDFSFYYSISFKSKFFSNNGKNLGFSEIEKRFVDNQIKEIIQFKEIFSKFSKH